MVQLNIKVHEKNISDAPNISTLCNTWCDGPPTVTRIPFLRFKGLKVYAQGNEPIDYLNLLFDERLFDMMVSNTNKYATQNV